MRKRAILGALLILCCTCSPVFAQSSLLVCNSKIQLTNIRSGPSAKGTTIVDKLPNKAVIKVLDRVKNPEGTHDWLKIEFKHTQRGGTATGFIYHEAASPTCGEATAAVAEIGSSPPTLSKLEPVVELTLDRHEGFVNSVAFSTDGSRIVTSSRQIATVWDAKSGAPLATLSGHNDHVATASFSPDGARIVTASFDKTAKIWDATTGSLLVTLSGHLNGVRSAAFSRDGSRIVTASSDNSAKVWDANTGSVLLNLVSHVRMVNTAAFSADDARIVTASSDKTAKIWDAKTGSEIVSLGSHASEMTSAVFSLNGARLLTISSDKSAKILDVRTGAVIFKLISDDYNLHSAVFSPDGARILTASSDNTARIWDAKTGALLTTLRGHKDTVSSAAFSPDGLRIVTGSWDNTAKVWIRNLASEESIALRDQNMQIIKVLEAQKNERKIAAADLECEKVKVFDEVLGADGQMDECLFNRQIKIGAARDLYLAAAKFDAANERAKARKLYQAIVDRFPNDDLALQSATRLTALADIDRRDAEVAKAKEDADHQRREIEQNARRAAESRAASLRCEHVYIGRIFEAPTMFGRDRFEILGVSPSANRVTYTNTSARHLTWEKTCDDIPR